MKVLFIVAAVVVGGIVAYHVVAEMSDSGVQWRRRRRFDKLVRARLRPRGFYAERVPFWNKTHWRDVITQVAFDSELGTYVLQVCYRRDSGRIQRFELARLGLHEPVWWALRNFKRQNRRWTTALPSEVKRWLVELELAEATAVTTSITYPVIS